MAKTIDSFTQHQTRLVVVIDGLDSCEQDKVLQMLDTVRTCAHTRPQVLKSWIWFQVLPLTFLGEPGPRPVVF